MRRLSISCLLVAGLALVFSLVALLRTPKEHAAESATTLPSRDETNPILSMCSKGLLMLRKHQGTGEGTEDDALTGAALVRTAWALQARHPAAAKEVWQLVDNSAGTLKPTEAMVVVTRYLESLDDALDVCDAPADFYALWPVRKAVVTKLTELERKLFESLASDLATLADEITAEVGKEDATIALFDQHNIGRRVPSASPEALKERVEALRSSKRFATATQVHELLQRISDKVQEYFDRKITELEKKYKAECERDAKLENSLEPQRIEDESQKHSDDEMQWKPGEYTQLLKKLTALRDEWESSTVSFWLQVFEERSQKTPATASEKNTQKDKETPATVPDKLTTLYSKVIRSLRIRYNVWALRTVKQAEDLGGARGAQRLSFVDRALLEPSVSALYSMAEAKCVQAITNPQQRSIQVMKMLNTQPVKLHAF